MWAQKAGQISRFTGIAGVTQPPVRQGLQPVSLEAKNGLAFRFNDTLFTHQGRLRAQLNDGSILSLGAEAKLKVTEHNERSQQSSFELQAGKLRAEVVRLSRPDSKFEVRTNTAVCGVLGTDEVVDSTSPVATVVIAISGVVTVRSSDPNVAGSVQLTAGQTTTVGAGKPPTNPTQVTPGQLNNAVGDTTGNTNADAQADLSTPQVEAGKTITLDGRASSGGLGSIASYLWSIPQRNFTSSDPVLSLDTTGWSAGVYTGTLTITSTTGRTATVNFKFTVISATTGSPTDTINNLAAAYESLQVRNFMNLFDPARYSGYAALEQSVTQSFANIQEIRVFVRQANGQIQQATTPGGNPTAIYQVDFEIRFTPKSTALPGSTATAGSASVTLSPQRRDVQSLGSISGSAGAVATFVVLTGSNGFQAVAQSSTTSTNYTFSNVPDGSYTVTPLRNGFSFSPVSRTVTVANQNVSGIDFTAVPLLQTLHEQSTVRMEQYPGRGYVITDIQGSLGSAGQLLPGTTAPAGSLSTGGTPGAGGSGGANTSAAGFTVDSSGTFPLLKGGSTQPANLKITPLNGFLGNLSVGFILPQGITVSGPATVAITSASPVSVPYTFSATNNLAGGTYLAAYTVSAGSGATAQIQQGSFNLAVQSLSLAVNGAGQAAGAPLFLFAGSSGSTNIQLTGTTLPVTFSTAPTPGLTATVGTVGANGAATVTINSTDSTVGPGSVQLIATPQGLPNAAVSTTIFVNRNAPVLGPTGPAGNVGVAPGQSAIFAINVPYASGFTGSTRVIAPVIAGLTFTPTTVTLTASGPAIFNVSATGAQPRPLQRGVQDAILSGNFTVTTGLFSTLVPVSFDLLPAFDFSISGGTLALAQGASAPFNVVITQTAGSGPQPVTVSATGVPAALTVTGGGSVSGSGTVVFTVTSTTQGTFSFTVQGAGPAITHTATVTVNVISTGTFNLAGASSITILDGTTGSYALQVVAHNGFNASVSIAASGIGATVGGPALLAAGATGNYTITPTLNTGSVTFTGTALGLTDTLTVPTSRVAGFTLSASPVAGFVGGTFPVTVTANRTGYNGSLTVTFGSAPTGVTVTPASVQIPAGATTATFSASVGAGALAGNINFQGTADGGAVPVSTASALSLGNPFTLSASPIVAFAGGTTNLAITVTRVAGFTGAVTVALGGGSGTGITVSPSSVTVASGANTANFVVTLGPTAVNSNLIFNGTAAGTTFTAGVQVPLTVNPPFTVALPPSLPSLTPGTSASTASIGVTIATGFTGTVSIGGTGPSGLSVSVTPSSLSASGSATLVVDAPVPASAPLGVQTITVSATSGGYTITQTISITVLSQPVAASFTVSAPASVTAASGFVSSFTITVTPGSGFVGSFTLTSPTAPSGGLFAISSVPSGSNFIVSATAAGNATGTQTLSFTVTGGGTSMPVSTTLVFVSPYSLTVTAPNTQVALSTGSLSAQVTPVAGVTGSVLVTPVATPGGGASFSPPSFTAPVSPSATAIFSATASTSVLGANNTSGSVTMGVNTSITGPGGTFTLNQNAPATTVTPAFTANAVPSSLTLLLGASNTVGVNVVFNTAFSGGVTAVAGTLPAGISSVSVPVPSVLSTTGSFTFTVTATPTATGTVTLPINVTGGGVTQTVNFSINFAPPITIATVSPVSMFVGTTTSVAVPITFIGAFAGSVALSSATYPTGFSSGGATTPASLSASGTINVPVTVAPGTTTGGNATLFFTTNGGYTTSTTVSLTPLAPFTATPVASSVNVYLGSSNTVAVNVVFSAPVSGGVTAAPGALPAGITSVTVGVPSVISVNGTIQLNVAASPTATGPVTLPINVTGAGFTQTVNFSVNFLAPVTLATVSPVSMFVGTTTSVAVPITFGTGFIGSVALSSATYPTGFSSGGATSPASLSASGTINVPVTVAPGTTAGGNATLFFTTDGGYTTSTTVSLTPLAPFTATPVASSVNVYLGSSNTVAVNVVFSAPVSGGVTAAPGALPAGITSVTVGVPSVISVNGTIQLNVAASPTATGAVTLPINVTGAGFTQTVNFSVNFLAPVTIATVSPVSMFVGTTTSVAVPITLGTGFIGSVALSSATYPTGFSSGGATSPGSLSANGTINVPVVVAPGTTAGGNATFFFTTNGGYTTSTSVSLTPLAPFTATAFATPVTVPVGSSSTVAVSVGFLVPVSGGVTASPGTLPSGVSSVTVGVPSVISFNGTIQLSVTASPTASGSAILPINVTGAGITQVVNFTVNFVPPFAVTVSPSTTITPLRGTTTTYTVNVSFDPSFVGSVLVSGPVTPPPGITSITPTSQTLFSPSPGSVTFSAAVSGTAPAGSVSIPVTVSNGSVTQTVTFTGTFQDPYSLTFNAPSSVIVGSTSTFTVNINPATGFSGTVSVTPTASFAGSVFFSPGGQSAFVPVGTVTPVNFSVTLSGTTGTATLGANVLTATFALSGAAPSTAVTSATGGSLNITGGASGNPGTSVNVPISLTLNAGVSADTLSFGVQVQPQSGAFGTAPSLSVGALGFTPGSLPPPNTVDTAVAGAISVLWSTQFSPITGTTVSVGTVTMTIPATATNCQSYAVMLTGGSSTFQGSTAVSLVPGGGGVVQVLPCPSANPLSINPQELVYTPTLPREGDTVHFRARVNNSGARSVSGLTVALMRGNTVLATGIVDVAAGSSKTVELDWKAERAPGELRMAVVGSPGVGVSLRNLLVARRTDMMAARRDRLSLSVRNEDCAGLRLRSVSQSSCGGSVDMEVMPVITGSGTLEVRLSMPDGGVRDMGATALGTGLLMDLPPDVVLQSQSFFEEGHTYLVRIQNRTALVRVARIRSSVNPRLAVLTGGAPAAGSGTGVGGNDRGGRGGSGGLIKPPTAGNPITDPRDQERTDRLLSSAQISIDLEVILMDSPTQ